MTAGNAPPSRGGTVEAVASVLAEYLPSASVRVVLECAARQLGSRYAARELASFLREVRRGVRMFADDETARRCLEALERFDAVALESTVPIEQEMDIVAAQSAARAICDALGFSTTSTTKVLTALSELTRNVVHYARRGEVHLVPLGEPKRGIELRVRDEGPGIANVADVLAGRVRSARGMGVGLRGSKALADELTIDTAPGRGTRIVFRKYVS